MQTSKTSISKLILTADEASKEDDILLNEPSKVGFDSGSADDIYNLIMDASYSS